MQIQPQQERRDREPAIPAHLDRFMSNDQLQTLHRMENFGWELYFVRRPLFEPAVPVMVHRDNERVAVILEDGELDTDPIIQIRH